MKYSDLILEILTKVERVTVAFDEVNDPDTLAQNILILSEDHDLPDFVIDAAWDHIGATSEFEAAFARDIAKGV